MTADTAASGKEGDARAEGPADAAGAAEYVIDVRNLRKSFAGREVVHGIALKVRRGEIYGFLGPNGSGKTTTIRMLCGLLTPDAGEGHCLGYDILRESRQIKLHVGYMTQQFSLYADLTVLENLAFMARVHGMPQPLALARKKAEEMGLADRMHQLAGTLSGGWKQRLALTACTLHEPELLLLDEPTAGVDPRARRDFWNSIHALAAKGVTVLVSTHYMDEAERCHELAYIYNGRILARGPVRRIMAESGLFAYAVSGPQKRLEALAERLQKENAVEIATFRGEALHLAGRDRERLQATVKEICAHNDLSCQPAEPTLEDVFIHFMNTAGGRAQITGAIAPDEKAREAGS